MSEMFKTILILSLFGSGITALLLCLKPITAKRFSAGWQYYVWIAVLLSMIVPAYKLIPKSEVQKIPLVSQTQEQQEENPVTTLENMETVILEEIPFEEREISLLTKFRIKIVDLVTFVWIGGVVIYLLVVILSYAVYIIRKRKNSVFLTDNAVLHEVKKELKIKRKIKIRMSSDIGSPMLAGVLFPVVYIPCREIPDEQLKMVFMHELTHYKRKDLLIKWFSLFVNAVHWFNPLAYLLTANVSESCEVSCDMAVTKNMSDDEQRVYMKTIIDLVE